MYVCVYIYIYIYICMCSINLSLSLYIYIYIYMLCLPSQVSELQTDATRGAVDSYILQRGVQWKQGVVVYMTLYTSSLYDYYAILSAEYPGLDPEQRCVLLIAAADCYC